MKAEGKTSMGGALLVTDDVTRMNLSTAIAVVKAAMPRRSCVSQKSPTQMSCADPSHSTAIPSTDVIQK